jgi:hypothetical protein
VAKYKKMVDAIANHIQREYKDGADIMKAIKALSLPTLQVPGYPKAKAGETVGTLKDGYIRRVPLPRVPQIQSTSPVACATIHRNPTHTDYLPIVRIPMWSDMIGSHPGVG